jgi:hypothetical protein
MILQVVGDPKMVEGVTWSYDYTGVQSTGAIHVHDGQFDMWYQHI